MLPRLCETCQRIFKGESPPFGAWRNHHIHLYQLQQSAFEGCFICVVLWPLAFHSGPPPPARKVVEAPEHASLRTGEKLPVSKYGWFLSPPEANPYNLTSFDFHVEEHGLMHVVGPHYRFYLQPLASKAGTTISFVC